jgi:hypothetical protein
VVPLACPQRSRGARRIVDGVVALPLQLDQRVERSTQPLKDALLEELRPPGEVAHDVDRGVDLLRRGRTLVDIVVVAAAGRVRRR